MPEYGATIIGTGSYLPEKIVTNDELSKTLDTSDEWISQRTGIRARRIAGTLESTATLGSHAATRALQAAGLEPKHLDLIVCATATPEMPFPSTGCFIAASLGLDSTPAYDLSAACSGFLYALEMGTAYIKSGKYQRVLVIGAETLTRIIDWSDRTSCILFGDGAGAAVLQRSTDLKRGVLYTSTHADGHGWEMIYSMPGSRYPVTESMIAGKQHYMKIRGRDVYKFAVQHFHEMIEDALKKTELTIDKVKLIIPHQVNQRIIDSALEKLQIPAEKSFINIDKYGNTSAASIPIALDEAVRGGRLKPGEVVIFVAFGAGLTWANAVVRM